LGDLTFVRAQQLSIAVISSLFHSSRAASLQCYRHARAFQCQAIKHSRLISSSA